MYKSFLFVCLLVLVISSVRSQSAVPQKVGGSKFALSVANLYFEVDSARGARISSFKVDNSEVLYVNFAKTDMAGSTFWPSPQSVWGWPPAPNLDNKPYTAKITGEKIAFKGAIDSKSQLRFYKTMYANASDTSVIIEYIIKNEKATVQKWAPWEITRVLATGLTVFQKGSGSVTGDMKSRITEENGYLWYDQDLSNSPGNKFFCDGKGWLAHVTTENILFLKKFENIGSSVAAPGEAEVEVYTASDDSYTELENQGAYTSIAAHDSVTWKVKWYARKLPVTVDALTGSETLAGYIEKILALDSETAISSGKVQPFCKVYPNPASDHLIVECSSVADQLLQLNIFRIDGRKVLSRAIYAGNERVSLSRVVPGMYIYELTGKSGTAVKGILTVKRPL